MFGVLEIFPCVSVFEMVSVLGGVQRVIAAFTDDFRDCRSSFLHIFFSVCH